MSILDFKGKAATPGIPVLYHLMSGQVFYCEEVKEDADSFVFNADRTLLFAIQQVGKAGQVNVTMQKLSEMGFKGKQTRVMKSNVAMVQDIGAPEIIAKAHEALSGLTLPSVN